MSIFDTHSHYNIDPLLKNWHDHWQKAQIEGVEKTVIVGSTLEDSQTAVEICKDEKNLYPAIGLHPEIIDFEKSNDINYQNFIDNQLLQLNKLVKNNLTKIVAIGEIGLDYYWLKSDNVKSITQTKKLQKYLLEAQLKIAIENNLPIIIHCRDKNTPEEKTESNAYWDLLEILQQVTRHQSLKFVLHCASGPISYIKQAVSLGAFIGFDGNITYPNANDIREIFKNTPNDKKLIETDAPFLPPQQHRGKTCEPWMISLTAKYIEENFDQNLDEIYNNSVNFFNLE